METKDKKEKNKIVEKENGKKEKISLPRLRIKVKAYDHRIIDSSVKQIIENALRQGAKIVGPVPLPTEIKKFTVNRSSFVHKDSREQFEMRIHKRMIDILNPNNRIIDNLQNINLPSGVDIEIKM